MKKKTASDPVLFLVLCFSLFVILVPVYGQESTYLPSWNSLQNHEIPAWFKDAKFNLSDQ